MGNTRRQLRDAEDSVQAPFENAGKSIRQMLEAELVRVCVQWLRHKGTKVPENEEDAYEFELRTEALRHEVKAYSHSLLIMTAPYKRGNEQSRKALVSESMAKAKHLERVFNERKRGNIRRTG